MVRQELTTRKVSERKNAIEFSVRAFNGSMHFAFNGFVVQKFNVKTLDSQTQLSFSPILSAHDPIFSQLTTHFSISICLRISDLIIRL